jgi:D-alanine-D-alanine ligase
MKKRSILILYTLPGPFLPDGSVDRVGSKSVLSRLGAIQEALLSQGYRVKTLEMKDDLGSMIRKILSSRADLLFNLCEEFRGQTRLEMHIAALLELLDIPFTGSPALVLGFSQDKGKTKSILSYHGIPTPAYDVVNPGEDGSVGSLRFPLIVKPLWEDGSLGISNDALVQDSPSLIQQMRKLHRIHQQPALVEEYIEGRELNVSILGNGEIQVLPISEIDFSTMPPGIPKICGYEAKWVESSEEFTHTVPLCPAPLSPEMEERVKMTSLRAYRVIGCRDYARVDIRLNPDGVPYVLEVNANPDISPDAGMSRSAKAAGLPYSRFIGRIVDFAWRRIQAPQASTEGNPRG